MQSYCWKAAAHFVPSFSSLSSHICVIMRLILTKRAGAEAMCKSVLDSLFPSFNVLSFFNFYCYRFFWLCCVAYGVFSPQTGIKHVTPAPQAWSLNQWTSREVPPILSSEIKEVNRIICVRSERRNPSSLWMYPTCSHGTRRTCWRENFSIYCSWKKEICCG